MATHITTLEDMPEPIVRHKSVSVSNDGSMMTVHDYGEYGHGVTDEPIAHGGTGEGPSPLQAVLEALCGCEAVTFHRASKDMGFTYDGIDFEAESRSTSGAGWAFVEVRPHFQTIRVQATVVTDESPGRLAAVVEETEGRCPVYNLMVDADVNIEMLWVAKAREA
jgi:putative redox protein